MMHEESASRLSRSGSDCEAGRHALVVVYNRSWRALFRKRYALRCWHCDLRVPEPPGLRGNWNYVSPRGIMAPPGPAGLRPLP
jgi:hypothetical protein